MEFAALGKVHQSLACLASPQLHYTEYPELRIFALHPGVIQTAMAADTGVLDSSSQYDTIGLPVSTALAISAGKAEWLRGRSGHLLMSESFRLMYRQILVI